MNQTSSVQENPRSVPWALTADRSLDRRRAIGAATNKSERFNRHAQWAGLSEAGSVTASARDEQRKMIKYNHLVANLLIFHTAVGMTRALDRIAADGLGDAIDPEALATLSPYQTEHITGSATPCSTCRCRPHRCPSRCRHPNGQAVSRPKPSL